MTRRLGIAGVALLAAGVLAAAVRSPEAWFSCRLSRWT